jgi:hypothetical protein
VRRAAALVAFLWMVVLSANGLAAVQRSWQGPAAAGAGREVLALIDARNTGAGEALDRAGAAIHWRSDLYILAMVPEAQLAPLGRAAHIFDRDPWEAGRLYYWVLVRGSEHVPLERAAGIEVLFSDGRRALVKAAPADAEQLPQLGYEIARVPREPLPPASGPQTFSLPAGSREFSGVIDEIVAAVSQARYTSFIQTLEDFGTRYSYAPQISEAADWIYDTFQGFGLEVERHEFFLDAQVKENIIATKTGTLYPQEVVFISGHYDSISDDPYELAPGADDNGSAVAAVLEAARILSDYDCQRTVKFACFCAEEQGLIGSLNYVGDLAGSGLEVVGNYNSDMIAWSGTDPVPPDLYIYTNWASNFLAEELRDAALHYLPEDLEPVVVVDPEMWYSDHGAFWEYGYPAIVGTEAVPWEEDFNPYYHTTEETVAHCDLLYAANVTRAILAALADTAGALAPADSFLVAGAGPAYGNPAVVRVFPPAQGTDPQYEFNAYGPLHYGVNVGCGNVDGESGAEILTGVGPGDIYGPHVRGFQVDGTPLPGLSFLAYGTNRWGVNVAAGNIDGDGFDEIITGAGAGAVFGPHVRAFRYDAGATSVSPIPGVSFLAYGTNQWGVNVTAGDIDGDGYDEIITGAGPGAVYGPHVRGWDVDGGPATAMPGVSFFAYGTLKYGVNVSSGDVDGDGIDEIITGAGPGRLFGAHVRGWNYDGAALTELAGIDFFAWEPGEARHGAKVFAGADLDGDGRTELVVGPGPDPAMGSMVKVYQYDGSETTLWISLQAFPEEWTHGVNVAAGSF